MQINLRVYCGLLFFLPSGPQIMNTTFTDYHLVTRFRMQLSSQPDNIAFREWSADRETALTWREAGNKVDHLSRLLLQLGIETQERVAICGSNGMAWTLADMAILQLRAITVPIYATNTAAQSAYVLNDAGIRTLFILGQAQFDAALQLRELCPQLQHILVLDADIDLRGVAMARHVHALSVPDILLDEMLQARIAERNLEDLFTLIYTSGTTGEPKGVMLDYRSIGTQLQQHEQRLALSERDVSLCFLPLAHVFERAWSFFVMHCGAQNVYLRDTDAVRDALQAIKPTVMCAVPRFYEKVFSAINQKVAHSGYIKKKLFHWAMACGREKFLREREGRTAVWWENRKSAWADKLVLSKLRDL